MNFLSVLNRSGLLHGKILLFGNSVLEMLEDVMS